MRLRRPVEHRGVQRVRRRYIMASMLYHSKNLDFEQFDSAVENTKFTLISLSQQNQKNKYLHILPANTRLPPKNARRRAEPHAARDQHDASGASELDGRAFFLNQRIA